MMMTPHIGIQRILLRHRPVIFRWEWRSVSARGLTRRGRKRSNEELSSRSKRPRKGKKLLGDGTASLRQFVNVSTNYGGDKCSLTYITWCTSSRLARCLSSPGLAERSY